jgi:membrane-bound ClpP family serine protease
MQPIALIFLLFAVGLVLLISELLLPTHGLLAVAGLCCFGGALLILFSVNQWMGLTIFFVAIVASPLLANLALKIWTHSPVGRRIVLQPVHSTKEPSRISLGQIGISVTELRPMGECDFADQRMEAVSQLGTIAPGVKVKIIAIDNGRPTVRVES